MFKKLIIPVAATSATASTLSIYLATKTENEELKKLEEQKIKEKKDDEVLLKQEIQKAQKKSWNDILNGCKEISARKNKEFWNNKYKLVKKNKTSFPCNGKTVTLWNTKKYSDNNLKITNTILGTTKRWWPNEDEISIFISIS